VWIWTPAIIRNICQGEQTQEDENVFQGVFVSEKKTIRNEWKLTREADNGFLERIERISRPGAAARMAEAHNCFEKNQFETIPVLTPGVDDYSIVKVLTCR
jgi:hypothetical protein